MKISIGINIHGAYKRQDQCIYVLKKLKEKHPHVKLYNITFSDEFNFEKDFIHLPYLNKTASDIIPNSVSKKPLSNQFFDILSNTDCDYFLFLNSDILLTEKALKLITDEYETYCFSRTDVISTDKLSDIIPWRIEIAGFDAWAVKKDWWLNNSEHFTGEYVYAEHLWDVFFTLTMFNNSKCMLCNKKNYIIHEKHDLNWNETSPEATHNSKLWSKSPYCERWKSFIYENLIKRQPMGQFLNPLDNEAELEQKFLMVK